MAMYAPVYRYMLGLYSPVRNTNDDDERTPLIRQPTGTDQQTKDKDIDSNLKAVCKWSTLKCKLGLHWTLHKLDMASLQSSRSQCCCCAIGVLAALFGIIMLSAGICIVLNVNYMEVDTSGLPPALHNEEGKKVVGIILICVALGAMGLSTTVSIVYFAVCNRKPRRPALTANVAGTGNEGAVNGVNHNSQEHRSHHRVSDASRSTSDSQLSLNSIPKQRKKSPALNNGRGATGMRKKVQKAKNHRKRHPRYQTGLPPHIEEPETSRSHVDLKLHRSTDSHPGTYKHHSTSYTVDETQQSSYKKPPVIVIDEPSSTYDQHPTDHHPCQQLHSTDNAHVQSVDMSEVGESYSDANYGAESMMVTEESTLYDEADTDELSATNYSTLEKSSSSDAAAAADANRVDSSVNQSQSHSSSDVQSDHKSLKTQHSHPFSTSPDSDIDVDRDSSKDEEGDRSSIDSNTPNGLVQNQPQSKSEHFSYPQSAVLDKDSSQWESNDQFSSELPPSSRHHEMYADKNDHEANDSDKRSESRSSFNSAFSNDGGDPDDKDMRKYMKR